MMERGLMVLSARDWELLNLKAHMRLRSLVEPFMCCFTAIDASRNLHVTCGNEAIAKRVVEFAGLVEQVYYVTGCCDVLVWVGNELFWQGSYEAFARSPKTTG